MLMTSHPCSPSFIHLTQIVHTPGFTDNKVDLREDINIIQQNTSSDIALIMMIALITIIALQTCFVAIKNLDVP